MRVQYDLMDAWNVMNLYLENIFRQISPAAVVGYIVILMELLWSDVQYLADILCSHQVLIIVHPRAENP